VSRTRLRPSGSPGDRVAGRPRHVTTEPLSWDGRQPADVDPDTGAPDEPEASEVVALVQGFSFLN
jgi:hypothetical protein